MPVALLLAASLAAPVPADLTDGAERKALEAHWNALWSDDSVARTRAVFALIDHPRAVKFLADKLPPVSASPDQLKRWLKDLDSDDEKEWKAAFEQLGYFDPRIGLPADEQLKQITTANGRWRLASVWAGRWIELPPNTTRITLELVSNGAGGRTLNFSASHRNGGTGWGLGTGAVADVCAPKWQHAATAAHVLRCLDTTASRAALKRLAAGHQDALPTRTAAELLKAKPASGDPFDPAWTSLLSGDPYALPSHVFTVATASDAAAKLKAELPAINATKEQITAWVKALDSDDEKTWKPACQKLQLFRPSLALTSKEQCELVTTDRGKWAVYCLAAGAVEPPADIKPDLTLEPSGNEGFVIRYNGGRGECNPGPLDTSSPPHWQRARMAIVVLERMKTDDAKAVLKQLADGHPDILPTKEARAALERMK